MRDYREYKLSWKERAGAVLVGALGAGAMIFLFFPTLVVTGGCALVGGDIGAMFSEEETIGTDAPTVDDGLSGVFRYAAAGLTNGTIVRRQRFRRCLRT